MQLNPPERRSSQIWLTSALVDNARTNLDFFFFNKTTQSNSRTAKLKIIAILLMH